MIAGPMPAHPSMAQPRFRRVAALTRVELRERARNGEQLMLLILLPLVMLWGSAALPRLETMGPQTALTTALIASAFTSVAISTGFERRYGVMRAMAATPADRFDLTAAKTLTGLVIAGLQVVVITMASHRADAHLDPAITAAVVVLAITALTPWAFLVAMTMRAERVLVVANLVFLGSIAALVWAEAPLIIPSVAVMTMVTAPSASAALVLGVWGVVGAAAAIRFSRWGE